MLRLAMLFNAHRPRGRLALSVAGIALGGAEGERLVLLLLFLADLLELVGQVIHAGVAHEALELDEPLVRLALDGERVGVQIDQGLRQ